MSITSKRYINEIVLCPRCKGEGRVPKNEKELYFSRFNESRYKTCPDCLGKRVLKKVGTWHYERI